MPTILLTINNLKGFNQFFIKRPPTIFNFKKNHNFKIKKHNNLYFRIFQQPKKTMTCNQHFKILHRYNMHFPK